jgi:hypothetical protein
MQDCDGSHPFIRIGGKPKIEHPRRASSGAGGAARVEGRRAALAYARAARRVVRRRSARGGI